MPELPEVEYTARQLRGAIVGTTIQEAQVFWPRTIGHPDLPEFFAEIAGKRILGIRRRGKLLILDLSGDMLLTIHRRMSGNLLLLAPGWSMDTGMREQDPLEWSVKGPVISGTTIRRTHCYQSRQAEKQERTKDQTCAEEKEYRSNIRYCRACFLLADGRGLLYTDPRKFGRIELWPRAREEEALEGLGIEPLSDEFTVEALAERLAGRKGAMKQVLLNQAIISGIGNIYADEALFYASLHPLRPAHTLTLEEIRLLREGIVSVLLLGIEHGGTSFSEYRDLWGEAGENYEHVRVYQQEGKPCPRCGTPIERIIVGQRGTHYCPSCQRLIVE